MLDGVGSQCHAPQLYTQERTRYLLYRRLSGPQDQSGLVQEKSLPLGFNPWTVQPVASCYTNYTILVHNSATYDFLCSVWYYFIRTYKLWNLTAMFSNQSAVSDGTPSLRTKDVLLCWLPRDFACLRVWWQWVWSSGGTMISKGKLVKLTQRGTWSSGTCSTMKSPEALCWNQHLTLICGMACTWMHILYHILLKYALSKLAQAVMLLTCVC